jgi:radical SAM superfamily enzyme YgiQ (UPF0313 family)
MTDLETLPLPRRDLYPYPVDRSYTPSAVGIETARGCPFDCEFCSTTQVLGKKFRTRPVEKVIRELESIAGRYLFFVDDSIGLDREVGRRLFREIVRFHKQWIGQATATLAEDPELLRLMKRSGCEGVIIGFESVDPKNQERLRKIHALRIESAEAVHRFHEEGIPILGAFVFGFDGEDLSIFDRTIDFALRHRLDGVQVRILTPFPGTRLHDRLYKENRLFDPHWWLTDYPPGTLLYRLRSVDPEKFVQGFNRMVKVLFAPKNIFRRFFGIAPWRRSAMGIALYAGVNYSNRKRYFREFEIDHPDLGRSGSMDPKPISGARPDFRPWRKNIFEIKDPHHSP